MRSCCYTQSVEAGRKEETQSMERHTCTMLEPIYETELMLRVLQLTNYTYCSDQFLLKVLFRK